MRLSHCEFGLFLDAPLRHGVEITDLVCSLSVFAVELVVMFCCFKCFKFKPT